MLFFSVLDYLPGGDDNFGFTIFQGIPAPGSEGEYVFNGFGAGDRAVANVLMRRVRLPDYVSVGLRSTYTLTMEDHAIPPTSIPEGHDGLALLEVLSYMPAGDDNFEYTIQPLRFGNTIEFVTRLDRGNRRSSVDVRVTVLHWPLGREVLYLDDRFVLTEDSSSGSTALPPWQKFFITAPTAYNTRGAKDLWYETDVESGRVVLTVGGGRDDSNAMVRVWALAFPD